MTFTYQKTNRYFAQIGEDLEELGKEELAELGGKNIKAVYRGIYFDADKEDLYRIIYRACLPSTILAQLLRFDCHSDKYLYKTAKKIDWMRFLDKDDSFAVRATVAHSSIRHSQYAALRLKDAIVDLFREQCGERPSIDKIAPDLFFHLHIENNKATISVDLSGGSLHRRGYRHTGGDAPLRETLAAAIIRLTGWDGERPLYDPMCGSGTLLAEALMHHARIPAAYLRERFGVSRLPDFDHILWKEMLSIENDRIRPLAPGLIRGSDISRQAVADAGKNLESLPGGERIGLQSTPFHSLKKLEDTIIVCNPPYGLRSMPDKPIALFLNEFGTFLRHNCRRSTAYIYFGEPELTEHMGLRADWKKRLNNGGLEGVLVKYTL